MKISLVFTVIGDDHPGLVEQLSEVIGKHRGKWLQSSMSRLSGKFAGIVCITIEKAHLDNLRSELTALPGLHINAEASGSMQIPSGRRLILDIVGHHRVGIVYEVSRILAKHAINVDELSTHTSSAPMSAEILFHATAELTTLPMFDTRTLVHDLEQISNDMMIDITLDAIADFRQRRFRNRLHKFSHGHTAHKSDFSI
jgi:glycine cleavage system regulatory protein